MNILNNSSNKIKAVIFDWAGTTVDYGCFAPADVFVEVFRLKNINITIEDARLPMGLNKRDHIKAITEMEHVLEQWKGLYSQSITENDIDRIYETFIPLQIDEIGKHTELTPGAMEALEWLRKNNIKVGSTTGYNTQMLDVLKNESSKSGFILDSYVCASDVKTGRPSPWMAVKSAEEMNIYPFSNCIKIGDTVADIYEGLNGNMWSVGVIDSSNEMGLTSEQLDSLGPEQLSDKRKKIKDKFDNAGAHFVINDLYSIQELIEKVNYYLSNEEKP